MSRARILADYVSGGTTAAEFDYLDGVTSNVQTQLDAKVSNATHTGDVTGGTALTIATDAVDIAMLSATGTASSSTFLRGDNAWEAAGVAGAEAFGVTADSSWANLSEGAICPFNDKTSRDAFDTGTNFDISTYKYGISATGVYLFYFGAYTSNTDMSSSFGFSSTNEGTFGIMNDGSLRFAADYKDTTGENSLLFAQVIFPFTNGDAVWVHAAGSSDFLGNSSYFGGCRLS